MKTLYSIILIFIAVLVVPPSINGQVLLNEVSPDSGMSDGRNDGIVELINAGGAPVDISCWVISNGEWVVTIPAGTILAAGDVFIIACGSGTVAAEGLTCDRCDFAGMPLDLDVCATPGVMGGTNPYFTIDNESTTDGDQVALFNSSGVMVDGLMWTTGSHLTGGSDVDLTANGPQVMTPPSPGGCTPPATVTLPDPTDGGWAQLGTLIRGCNSSYIRDIGSTNPGSDANFDWSITDHPTPGEVNDVPTFNFSITDTELCAGSTVTVTTEVYNYQHVQPTVLDAEGLYGSYIKDETGTIIAWPSITNDGSGTTSLSYTSSALAAGTYTFVAQWDDYTEGCCGSSSPTSGNECYERQEYTVTVVDPFSLTGNNAITCPTDFVEGQVNLATLVSGGLNVSYELFDNGVSQGTNTTGTFNIPDTYTGPITATATNSFVGCGMTTINFTIDNSCRLPPPCPAITNSSLSINGTLCGMPSACPLDAGTIAFVLYNADATPDQFAFVVLSDIDEGTVINFTDDAWEETAFRNAETTISWTAPAGGVTAGTVITITGTTASAGTVTGSALVLSASGDQIIAYCGDASSPSFIAAINNQDSGWQTGGVGTHTANTTALPTGLIDGAHAVALTEVDNAAFLCDGGAASGTAAEIAANINLPSNWVTDNASPLAQPACTYNITPPPPCPACPGDLLTLTVEGTDLPSGGSIDWYVNTTSPFDPYSGAGTLVGSSPIPILPTPTSIVLNEVGIRPATGNAGAGGEYIEILCPSGGGDCDISGFRISDGDFAVTVPAGTVIPEGGYYMIGGFAVPGVDLVVTAGSNFNLTDDNEQIAIFDCTGNLVTGVSWGGGQSVPATLTAPADGDIPAQDVTIPNTLTDFTPIVDILYQNGGTWINDVNANATPDAANVGGDGSISGSGTPCAATMDVPDFNYTVPADACNGGPYYIKGIINPHPNTGACPNSDPSASTAEFEYDVICPVAVLSGEVVACAPPASLNLEFTDGPTGDYDVTLLNTTTSNTVGPTTVTVSAIPEMETINVTESGEYIIQSIVPAGGGCDAEFSGSAVVSISDGASMTLSSITPGASCAGGDYEIIYDFNSAELPVEFTYTIDGGAPIVALATSNPFVLLTPTTGTYAVIAAVDASGCPVTLPANAVLAATPCTQNVSGMAWYDGIIGAGDGFFAAGTEEEAVGIVVNLYTANGTFVASTTTDIDGTYSFANVANGDYYVEFEYPAGYQSAPQVGSGPGDNGSDVSNTGASGPDQTFFTLDDLPGGVTGTFTVSGSDVTNLDAGIEGPSPILPVELLSFTARKRSDVALLEWSTASEINSEKFVVERSDDGVDFTDIGEVAAAGESNTQQDYQFVDDRPLAVNYYRLRQVDIDGKTALSQVEVVFFSKDVTMILSPNPAQDEVYLSIGEAFDTDAEIVVYDVLGNRLGEVALPAGTTLKRLSISHLPKGAYIIGLSDGLNRYIQKLVKVK